MKTEWTGGCLTAFLTGEIDHHAAQDAREEIEAALEQTGSSLLRMDFSGVTFMDSAGIGLILGRYRKMQEVGGTLRVVHASSRMERLMRIAGLSTLNVIEPRGKE